MRNILDVVAQIQDKVPEDQGRLHYRLDNVHSSALYRAPEMMFMSWDELQETLITAIGEFPKEDWQFEVLSIFSTVPVSEIRRDVEARLKSKEEKDQQLNDFC